MYWVVRKVHANFEGKLKRRTFKFLISFIKFKSFAARTFRTTQYIQLSIINKIRILFSFIIDNMPGLFYYRKKYLAKFRKRDLEIT